MFRPPNSIFGVSGEVLGGGGVSGGFQGNCMSATGVRKQHAPHSNGQNVEGPYFHQGATPTPGGPSRRWRWSVRWGWEWGVGECGAYGGHKTGTDSFQEPGPQVKLHCP